jgi:hypothetical protein
MNAGILAAVSLASTWLAPPAAFGWGSYGHEQINNAAVDVLVENAGTRAKEAADCMRANKDVLTRLAITPDMDWKLYGDNSHLAPDELAKKTDDDKHEHPLHFFEADAFSNPPPASRVTDLPSGEYKEVFAKYRELLAQYAAKAAEIDPDKALKDPAHPTPTEVTGHGTAPWRAQQLYRLGVAALKKRDFAAAIFYLGTMGHYVGDMSQPFHATLNFNGQHYATAAAGIHAVFEEGILELVAKDKSKANTDTPLGLWSNFSATDNDVTLRGAELFAKNGEISSDRRVVAEILALIAESGPYIEPLLKIFSEKCEQANGGKLARAKKPGRPRAPASGKFCTMPNPKVGPAITGSFAEGTIELPGGKTMKVLDAAKRRMGDSAGLLARLWASAFADAGRPTGCVPVKFEALRVIDNYPMPDYLPAEN